MNLNKYLLIGTLSVIATNALAEGQNIMTSKSYVDAQDALKQDVITTGLVEFSGIEDDYNVPALVVTNATGTALNGNTVGVLDWGTLSSDGGSVLDLSPAFGDSFIPTARSVARTLTTRFQLKIPKSGFSSTGGEAGFAYNDNAATDSRSWLHGSVKGTGLVTRTATDGTIGERKIFEASDLTNYHAQNLTQNQKDIQDISIPTVGAMMSAISNGITAAAPTGTANTIANYDANGALGSGIATYTGAAAYNATNDSAKIPTMAGVATYAQAKMTCAGWPDSVAVADRTDENCWLWQKN